MPKNIDFNLHQNSCTLFLNEIPEIKKNISIGLGRLVRGLLPENIVTHAFWMAKIKCDAKWLECPNGWPIQAKF